MMHYAHPVTLNKCRRQTLLPVLFPSFEWDVIPGVRIGELWREWNRRRC